MTYSIKSKKNLTCKKIHYFMKDEKKASKEYKEYGLPKLAKQEDEHYKFFKKLEKKSCK